ncbi:MAG: LysR family transcriptional regulator [Pseudomonadota bacterium]
MNLRFLKTVIAVSQHSSLNAAARSLGLSHSAVSLQIKALEEELEFQILDRSKRPPVLTAEGLALVEHARRMEDISSDIEALADRRRLHGRVTLGAVPSTISNITAPALAAIHAEHPDLKVELMVALSQRLIELVSDGTVHAALVTDPKLDDPNLALAEICNEPFHVITSLTEPLETLDELLGERSFIWFDRRSRLSQQVEAYLLARGLQPRTAMEVDSFEAVEALVRYDLGVSILPKRALTEVPEGIRSWPLDAGAFERRVVLASRRNAPRSRLISKIAEAMRSPFA